MRRLALVIVLIAGCAPPRHSPPTPHNPTPTPSPAHPLKTGPVSVVQRGAAQVHCKDPTAIVTFDPIVYHRLYGLGHQHQFFANATLPRLPNPPAAGYLDLVGQATNCDNPNDTAAYWTPTLLDGAGRVVPTQAFIAYYRSWDMRDAGDGAAPPPDTRLISPMTTDVSQNNWTCGQFEREQPTSYIPDCTGASGKPGHTLTAHVTFPSCWDGVRPSHSAYDVGDTRDNAHWAYRSRRTGCPPDFP